MFSQIKLACQRAAQKVKDILYTGTLVPRSKKWPEVRKRFLAKNPCCAACGSKKNLQVHHVMPFHIDKSKELDENNLITLCETIGTEHHLMIGHFGNWQDFNPNVRYDASNELKRRMKKVNVGTY